MSSVTSWPARACPPPDGDVFRSWARVLTQRGSAFLTSGLVLLAAGVLLGQPDLTRVGVLLLSLLVICHILGHLRATEVTVHRTVLPNRISVDDTARVGLEIRNIGDQRTSWMLAEERLDPDLGDSPRLTIPPLGVGRVSTVEYTVRPPVRGLHPLGPLRIWRRDPFGLTSAAGTAPGSGALLVIPRIHPLEAGRILGRGIGDEGAIPHQVALHGEDDQAIREYRDGDDLRRIHWPATARTGSLMVRQEDRPARRRAVILLDSRAGGHRGHGASSSFEWFVTMAASVAAHAVGLGYAVHLLSADPGTDAGVRSDEDLDAMLDTLARVRVGPDDDFGAVLRAAHGITGAGGLLVALTTALDDDAGRALASLRQAGSTAIAFVHDPGTGAPGPRPAGGTVAVLHASGWLTAGISGREPPSRMWAQVTGAPAHEAPAHEGVP